MSNEPTAPTLATIVFDTGPLLCFGHIPRGVRVVRQRYQGRMRWTEAVMDEVAVHAQRPRTSRNRTELGAAAEKWHGQNRLAFGDVVQLADRVEVDKMRQLVRAEEANPKTGDSDLGESETLVYADQTASVALINENAARKVASNIGVRAHCALDVLIAEYQEDRLSLTELRRMWEMLRASGLDAGEYLPSNAGQLRRWATPAPR